MVAQHPPFTQAIFQDPFYRCLASNRADLFWKTHCKNKPGKEEFFSEDFKSLVQSMLQLESVQRPSIADVINHPWMTGEVPTQEQIIEQFKERQKAVVANIEAEKEEKAAQKQAEMQQRGLGDVCRGPEVEEDDF